MKKVIGGKRYDTQTARLVGETEAERLYIKRNGEYFAHRLGSDQLLPISYETAQAWGLQHLDSDLYAALFAPPQDDIYDLHVQVPSDLVDAAKRTAVERGITLSAYIASLLHSATQ